MSAKVALLGRWGHWELEQHVSELPNVWPFKTVAGPGLRRW